jgi:ankyrin repeat protein
VQLLLAADPPLDIFESAAVDGGLEQGARLLAAEPALATAWSPDGFTPLHLASYFGNEAMARILLAGDADPDVVSRNGMALRPIHSACAGGSLSVARALLARGVDVNARQNGGWTPLHSAVNRGELALVELLLEHGALPELANADGKSALNLADERGFADISRLMREWRMTV